MMFTFSWSSAVGGDGLGPFADDIGVAQRAMDFNFAHELE